MRLNELKRRFRKDEVSKPEYIKRMYEDNHSILFEYSNFIKNTDIQRIEITDDSIIMTTRRLGIKMVCSINDHRDIPIEILNFDEYEKQDSDMILNLVNDGDTVFDIGGNMGWYSIALSKVKDNLDIHTFEPIPNTYKNLVSNIRINGANVNIYNIGLSDTKDELTFYFYPECSGNASSALMNEEKDNIEIKCSVDTIDNFCSEKLFEKLDFIKCDVEGAELLTFKGGYNTINKFKPIVFTEMLRKWSAKFNYHPNETMEFFTAMGYRCFYVVENQKLEEFFEMNDDTIQTNFFFLHNTKHRELIEDLVNA